MRIVPILLKPRLLGIKNRWFGSGVRGLKELFAITISIAMMYGMYASTSISLKNIHKALELYHIGPELPLGVILCALFIMIYLSASVCALGSLFSSKDLDLVRAAPITMQDFLIGKIADVALSVSWMVCMFGLPSLIAFGEFYGGGALFAVIAPLICVGFFAVATMLGMITALLFGAAIPSGKGKPIFALLFLGSVVVFIALTNGFSSPTPLLSSDPEAMFERLSNLATNPWLPSNHCANAIVALIGHVAYIPTLFCLELGGAIAATWLLLQIVFRFTYATALKKTRDSRGTLKIHSKAGQLIATLLFPFSTSISRAIMTKEYKVFSRDITHTVQMALLLAITFVYLYNYQLLKGPAKASEEVLAIWNIFLLLSNIALGSLIVISICSRFVFPSVSLEGSSYWLLQAAPISLREILRAKFRSWLLPVSGIGATVFVSGAMALNADGPLVIASCIAGIIVCHGLVGLGIGLGARFSQFEWEHSAQLSTSFGNFIFMIASILFLGLNMIPLGLMFATYSLFLPESDTSYFTLLVLSSGLLSSYVLNKIITWWALSAGARALTPR